MLHHLSFACQDLQLSGCFYDAALGELGFRRVFIDASAIGYGNVDCEDIFCLKLRADVVAPNPGFHVAFVAKAAVEEFYRQALQMGARDNGAQGSRLAYGENYYAAFLIDPRYLTAKIIATAEEAVRGSEGVVGNKCVGWMLAHHVSNFRRECRCASMRR